MNPKISVEPNRTTGQSPAGPDEGPGLGSRFARKLACAIEHDRRIWNRLMRRFVAEDRWICQTIKAWLRPAR